eukprot:TRINITY_DN1699_c0_g1_i1.p1 TRINITY_DN1699_c0_g1~~TRINITY_DN1699_c0_g1_i1.p1  ORF type:complete len:529 (-),score=112.99 TRINITY_DN1699_c0_g1_i1:27-1613(-)
MEERIEKLMDWSIIFNNINSIYEDTVFTRLYTLFTEPATSIAIFAVMATLAYGARNSIIFFEENEQELTEMNNPNTVQGKTAILMPIVGSIMLLVLFYFLKVMIYILYVMIAISALMGMMLTMEPVFYKLLHDFPFPSKKELKIKTCKGILVIDIYTIAAFLFGALVITGWVVFKSWIFVDFMAFCLASIAISTLKIPSMKISTMLLSMFFFYDIFWVFLSEYVFGSNVMVTVAVKMISNTSASSFYLPIPIVIIIPRFFGSNPMLLGLGDIILPGIFLSFLYRFDTHILSLKKKCSQSRVLFMHVIHEGFYFRVGYLGYLFGMMSALIGLVASKMAQPALLYLVPYTLIPTLLSSLLRGEFRMFWTGNIDPSLFSPSLDEESEKIEMNGNSSGSNNNNGNNEGGNNDEEINLDLLSPNFPLRKFNSKDLLYKDDDLHDSLYLPSDSSNHSDNHSNLLLDSENSNNNNNNSSNSHNNNSNSNDIQKNKSSGKNNNKSVNNELSITLDDEKDSSNREQNIIDIALGNKN